MLDTRTVTSTTTSVALRRSSSKSPISTPIVTAASVAAAWASERPNRSRTCGRENASRRPDRYAAAAFPTNTTSSDKPAIASTRGSVNFAGSMSIPVESRKKGISSTPPTNSICSISRLRAGTSRFNASPAKKAPTMPSIPARSATSAADVSATSTKRKRAPRCWPTPAKTHRVTRGSTRPQNAASTIRPSTTSTRRTRRTSVALDRPGDDREHRESEGVRHHRPAACDAHRPIAKEPALLDDRICDERVGCPERPEEQRGREPVAEGQHEEGAQRERDREREGAEGERCAPVRLELVEVELEAREEHEDEDPQVAERLDGPVALDPAEYERPDDQATEDDPDDARKPDPLDEQRADEDDERRDEERPLGRRGRELDGERHGASVSSASDEPESQAAASSASPGGAGLCCCEIGEHTWQLAMPLPSRQISRSAGATRA